MRSIEFISENFRNMNKYGIWTSKPKDGDFQVFQHDTHLGTFKTIQDVDAFLKKYLHSKESVEEALKFQNKFKVGDKIKAYDFEPMPDRPDRFVVGSVIKVDATAQSQPGALGYHIKVEKDEPSGKRVGQTIFVPYEIGMDHDDRVTAAEKIEEGASMMPYFKDPKDEKQMTWTFPDAWAKDEPLDTPYMSNASMRDFLDTLGYNPDFEDNQPPVPAKEFIARTTQWLQKNIDKPSAYEPTQVDKNPGGPTMYSGGREEGYMNQQIKAHNELARKIIAKYPEVTHFGFN
tara:strand:- start:196 stop:1062 length:867 start_codon:yes stop_codon:yes gene_type:complete